MFSSPSKAGAGHYSTHFSPKTVELKPVKSFKCQLRSPQPSAHLPVGRMDKSPITRHSLQSAYKRAMHDACVHVPTSSTSMRHSERKLGYNAPLKASELCQIKLTKEPSRNLLRSFSDELGAVQEEPCVPDLALCHESVALLPTSQKVQPLRTSISPPPPVELIDSVMTGDALAVIMKCLPRQDIGSLRLTCKRWGAAIRQKVTALAPACVPPVNVGERFPAASKLDLTSLGAKRFRSIKGSMLSCKSMLTSLEIGDNKHGGGSWLCNQDMQTLASLNRLQSLKIFNPKSLTQRGIENLSQLHELEDITIDKCKNLTLSLAHTCALWPALKSLRLGGCKLHTPAEQVSTHEPGHDITELFLRSCSIQDPGLLDMCSFKSLQSLRIEKTIVDCSSLTAVKQLSTLTALTQLKVINVSVEPPVLCSILKRLKYLKSLKVAHTAGTPREIPGMLDCFKELVSLEEVDLEGIKVPWRVLDSLLSAKSIIMPCPTTNSPGTVCAERAKVQTLVLRNVKSHFILPATLTKAKFLTTFAVCVKAGYTGMHELHKYLQELRTDGRRVLAYGCDTSTGEWKAAPIS